jgi:uncharacterized protein (TIGR02186 family)
MIRFLATLLIFLATAASAHAERLVSTLSNTSIQITSSFAGEVLTLFGNIEPSAGEADEVVQGPFHVIIVIEGPLADGVARRKRNVAGIWVNTEQVTFNDFPSYFQVMASGKLGSITNPTTLAVENIDPAAQARHSTVAGYWDSAVFGQALVRLMTERGHFGVRENSVRFLSNTAYAARLVLPHDVPNGSFAARTYVFQNGTVVAERSEGFTVQKMGFERLIYSAAVGQPFLYGLVCVMLAIFTGWLGGVVFRR